MRYVPVALHVSNGYGVDQELAEFVQCCGPLLFSDKLLAGADMNEVTRTVTEEILGRADEAIGRGEARGPKLDQCWKRLEKLNGGIVGPKSWKQIKKIAEAALADGKEPEA